MNWERWARAAGGGRWVRRLNGNRIHRCGRIAEGHRSDRGRDFLLRRGSRAGACLRTPFRTRGSSLALVCGCDCKSIEAERKRPCWSDGGRHGDGAGSCSPPHRHHRRLTVVESVIRRTSGVANSRLAHSGQNGTSSPAVTPVTRPKRKELAATGTTGDRCADLRCAVSRDAAPHLCLSRADSGHRTAGLSALLSRRLRRTPCAARRPVGRTRKAGIAGRRG